MTFRAHKLVIVLLVLASEIVPSSQMDPYVKNVMDFWTPEMVATAEPVDMIVDPYGVEDLVNGPMGHARRLMRSRRSLVVNGAWQGGGDVSLASGRLFIMRRTRTSYCSATAVRDGVVGRSLILTAAHCVYRGRGQRGFGTHFVFVPGSDDGGPDGTNALCNDDPFGCWVPRAGYVERRWTTLQRTPTHDYALLVVPDSDHFMPGYRNTNPILDEAVPAMPIELSNSWLEESPSGIYMGYPGDFDPDLRYCSNALGTMVRPGREPEYVIFGCLLEGGASGGPGVVNQNGKIYSVAAALDRHDVRNFGPMLYNNSFSCLLAQARFEDIPTSNGFHGRIVDYDGTPCVDARPTTAAVQVPSNDNCRDAEVISPGLVHSGTTVGSTPDPHRFARIRINHDGPGVWYRFYGTGQKVHIYMKCPPQWPGGTSWTSQLTLYSAVDCESLGLYGGEEGFQGPACNAALGPIQTQFSRDYWILVNSPAGFLNGGDFELSIVEEYEPDSLCEHRKEVLTGNSCDEDYSSCKEFVSTCKGPGTYIYPNYATSNCVNGAIEFTESGCSATITPPANDECSDATPVTVGKPVAGSTDFASISSNVLGWGVDSHGPTVWYSFVGTGLTLKLRLDCSNLHNAGVTIVSGTCTLYGGDYHGLGLMCEEGYQIDGIETAFGRTYLIMVQGGSYACTGRNCDPPRRATGNYTLHLDNDI